MPGDGEASGGSAVAQLESEMEGLDAGKFFYEEETSSTEEGSCESGSNFGFTVEEINNLKNTVISEGQMLKDIGLTNDQLGPAIAGAYDRTTGKIYTVLFCKLISAPFCKFFGAVFGVAA